MESKFITIDENEIHYQVTGKGPNVLLLIHSAVGEFLENPNESFLSCRMKTNFLF